MGFERDSPGGPTWFGCPHHQLQRSPNRVLALGVLGTHTRWLAGEVQPATPSPGVESASVVFGWLGLALEMKGYPFWDGWSKGNRT